MRPVLFSHFRCFFFRPKKKETNFLKNIEAKWFFLKKIKKNQGSTLGKNLKKQKKIEAKNFFYLFLKIY